MAAAGLLAFVFLAGCGNGGGTDTVISSRPSSSQLSAMSSYFLRHYWGGTGPTSRAGCATYSLGEQATTNDRLVVYTQVICQQCPEGTGTAAITPAVFVLQGDAVRSAQADTEPGDPMFSDVIARIFPPSLRSAANDQAIPNVQALVRQAAAKGGC